MKSIFLAAILAGTAFLAACSEEAEVQDQDEMAAVEEAAAAIDYGAILAAEDRSEADKERDAIRKPAEVLALIGLKPGDVVVDVGAGSGYYSEVFARVVGAEGLVHSVNNPSTLARFAQITPALEARAEAVKPATIHPMAMEYHEYVDYGAALIFMGQMYHEIIRQDMDAMAINAKAFSALKPGGLYVIEVHNAVEGAGREVSETYHRADPAIVRAEILAAGFELVEENTELLGNPEDSKEIGIFDETIRGKTDRTLFIFRKPE